MGSQPQVVVGGEVDDLFAVELRLRGACRFEHAQALEGAFRAPLIELVVKIGERVGHGVTAMPTPGLATPLDVTTTVCTPDGTPGGITKLICVVPTSNVGIPSN